MPTNSSDTTPRLTRPFAETVRARAAADPEFAQALAEDDWMQRAVDAEEMLRDVHGALDAILRGQHLGWDRALSAARERCRVVLESCNG